MRFTVASATPNQAFTSQDRTLYAYLTARCHTANISSMRAHAEALEAQGRGRINLLLFVDTPATIGRRGREATTRFVNDMTGRMTALTMVLNANAFWRSMFRSAVSGGLIRSKNDYPIVIVGDIPEAIRTFHKNGAELQPADAEEALRALRAAVLAATAQARQQGDVSFAVPDKGSS